MNPPSGDPLSADQSESSSIIRLFGYCVAVGVIAGLGAIAFYWLLEAAQFFFLDMLAGYRPGGPAGEEPLFHETTRELRRWVLFIVPAIGGLASGLIVYWFAPEAAGHGTDAAIEAYHFRDGAVRARVPLVKTIASALTIGSGGSGGREGPIAQIGAGFASALADRMALGAADRRKLMAAGMAAGIGAIFHAPLAGALFASEVLYRDADIEHEVLVPSFISSIIAYSVFATKFGWSPVFATPDFVFNEPIQLIPYLALAFVVALGAYVYIHVFYGVHGLFVRLKVPGYFKPAIGGLLVGAIGLFLPEAIGTGYGVLQSAFQGEIGVWLLLAVAVGKIATTSFSIGSGGSGGVFGPAIVIGGCLGGAVGIVASNIFPQANVVPGAFVIVGMAGFFAAAAHTPISTLIMVSEMTGNYHLLVPAMLVCVVGSLLTRKTTLYRAQLESRLDAPSKMGNMLSAVLRKIPVERVLASSTVAPEALVTVSDGMNLREIIDRFSGCDQRSFPIVDGEGLMIGAIDGRDIRRALGDDAIAELIVARDLSKPAVTLTTNDTLLAAVQKMTYSDLEEIIVVDAGDRDRPLATLSHSTVVRAYDQALHHSDRNFFDEA